MGATRRPQKYVFTKHAGRKGPFKIVSGKMQNLSVNAASKADAFNIGNNIDRVPLRSYDFYNIPQIMKF